MKTVAQFIGTIQDGGAETLVKDYALLLNKSLIKCIVIVLYRNRNTANDLILENSKIKIIPIYNKTDSFLIKLIRKLNNWWYPYYRLKKIIKKENIDVLHVHLSFLHYVKRIAKSIKNVKLFYTCHSLPEKLIGENCLKENLAAKYLLKNNGLQIIALHDEMRKAIDSMFGINNTIVIRNGINFDRFKNVKETKENIRTTLNIPFNAFVVGHVGRFSVVKNHSFLVDIFCEILKKKPDAFLLLIGDGEKKQEIINKLNDLGLHNKYLILSNRSDIPQLLRAMDVFVFPSLYEGLSISLIEAQVSEIRCIASDRVPKETFKTQFAVPVSLEKSSEEWCRIILDNNIWGSINGNIEDYDMNKEIRRLENFYLS